MNEYKFPFEKLEIWKLSVELSLNIYQITENFPNEEKFGIISQIRRSSNSVGGNIAEGISRFSNKEKARFIEYHIRRLWKQLIVYLSL